MALKASKAVLKQGKTVLFISDMQEKFAKNIYEFDKIAVNISKLVNRTTPSRSELKIEHYGNIFFFSSEAAKFSMYR